MIVRVSLKAPAAVGVKVTVKVVLAPAAIAVVPGPARGEFRRCPSQTGPTFRVAVPRFCIVNVTGTGVPTTAEPKA